jgi:hypothetical protein
LLPECATAESTVTFPAPEQSLAEIAQLPPGVPPVWFSKPSHIAAPAQPAGGLTLLLALADLLALALALADALRLGLTGADELGALLCGVPLQKTPSTAKFVGIWLTEPAVPWKPNSTVPPAATVAL